MPAKDIPISTKEERYEVKVVEPNYSNQNFKEIKAASTKSTKAPFSTASEFEDFIKSEEFLGDSSLFVRYPFFEDESEGILSESSETSQTIEEEFATPLDINDAQGSDFNLGSDSNLINEADKNLINEELEQFLLSLPNQIRALFLYQMGFVKKVKGVPTGDLIRNLKTQAVMNINYFKIAKVEIFDGYEMSESGEIMINEPKFKLLTREDVDSISITTLCRIKRYYDNHLKIKRDVLTFPIENQHFFIKPSADPEPIQYETKEARAKNISIKHFISKKYNLLGSTSNIIKQPQSISAAPAASPTQVTTQEAPAAVAPPTIPTPTTTGGTGGY